MSWITDLQDQYFATRLLEKLTNGRVQDQDFLKIKSGTRLGQDQESQERGENMTKP